MMRVLFHCISISLLTGCAVFPPQETTSSLRFPNHDTTPISAEEMHSLVPGEWYQVRLPERDGRSLLVRGIVRNGYVGRLQESDENSLTLTEVTKCTLFDSTSALRHLPFWGSRFEEGWMSCKNQSDPVTVHRTQLMWLEPITPEQAEPFRNFDEIANTSFEIPTSNDSRNQNAPAAELSLMPDSSFLLPNPQREEVLSHRRIEILKMQADQWYLVFMRQEGQGTSNSKVVHLGLVQQINDNLITLTNLTTQRLAGRELAERIVESSPEMTLQRSRIEKVRQIPSEQVDELIAEIHETPE